ncbi:MAG: S-methyl-5-thioribose-1-phosphate isomerase [Candidatus Zixiibacteriota bacterium]
MSASLHSVLYREDRLELIDQTMLPGKWTTIRTTDYRKVVEAINNLAVRGAPALGIAGAYAVALAAGEATRSDPPKSISFVKKAMVEIEGTRPTAVNLSAALARQRRFVEQSPESVTEDLVDLLLSEAHAILREDELMCRRIGEFGAKLVSEDASILTICNTGALATGGIGTALGVIYTASEQRKAPHVYVCETRPALQGARLTAWELQRAQIDCTLIVDSAAGALFAEDTIDMVIVGADRIAVNGDTANKIGTYTLAQLAKAHHVPFYVAAPETTFDRKLPELDKKHIECRDRREVTSFGGVDIAPEDTRVYSPAFDITPREIITAYITDKGVPRGGRWGEK